MSSRRRVLQLASGALGLLGAAAAPPRRRAFSIRYRVELPGSPSSGFRLWLPVPHDDPHQRIEDLRFLGVDHHGIHREPAGNQYLFSLVKGGSRVEMSFRVERLERRELTVRGQFPDPECCLSSDRLVPIDGRIRAWAEDVVRGARAQTSIEKARAIYEHVVDTVKYDKSGKGWGCGDIYYACDTRRGNCSDFHAIFIGYCRAVGVPAKFAIGLPLPGDRGSGQIAGYHCWAEFFSPAHGWVAIDASEAAKDPARRRYFFGALDENRVEFSKGRDLRLTPPQKGEPLNFFVFPYAEDLERPIDGLVTRIHYNDIG